MGVGYRMLQEAERGYDTRGGEDGEDAGEGRGEEATALVVENRARLSRRSTDVLRSRISVAMGVLLSVLWKARGSVELEEREKERARTHSGVRLGLVDALLEIGGHLVGLLLQVGRLLVGLLLKIGSHLLRLLLTRSDEGLGLLEDVSEDAASLSNVALGLASVNGPGGIVGGVLGLVGGSSNETARRRRSVSERRRATRAGGRGRR